MNLNVSKETETGLNTEFVNMDTGRHIPLQQAIDQIQKGNPKYKHYETVDLPNGSTYVRSKADKSKRNNIER
ncbi:MAG: DUF3892 domain-containing protein [Lachnospiraceae bacterium]|nr:DUF3892 domain-containing protein [Lachnospiraceae bacterium]